MFKIRKRYEEEASFRPRKGCKLQLNPDTAVQIRSGFRPREGCKLQLTIVSMWTQVSSFRPRKGCKLQSRKRATSCRPQSFPSP